MCDTKKADTKFSCINDGIFLDDMSIKWGKMRKFFLAFLHHKDRKISGIKRRIADTTHDKRNTADMVEMSVCYEHCSDFVFAFLEICGVWNYVIYTGSIFCFKLHSCVDNYNIVSDFYGGHIFADFFDSTERNYSNNSFFWWGNQICFVTHGSKSCWRIVFVHLWTSVAFLFAVLITTTTSSLLRNLRLYWRERTRLYL